MVSPVHSRSHCSILGEQRGNRKGNDCENRNHVRNRNIRYFGNIEFGNDSKIAAATSSSSIRGMSINMLYLDEFAFVEDAETFYTATYPVITSGKDSKVIITSTANGVGNMFHKIYESAVHDQSEYKSFLIKLV